jgi:hypothetical protein
MIQIARTEIQSLFVGIREFIYSIAEKVDYRMKSFKLDLRGTLIERELDRAYIELGKKAVEKSLSTTGTLDVHSETFVKQIHDIQNLKEQYSLSLQELSDLQRKALKESLSHCAEQFQRSGWEMAQIDVPAHFSVPSYRVKDIPFKKDFLVLLIRKEQEMTLVTGETVLEPENTVICIGTGESLQNFRTLLSKG